MQELKLKSAFTLSNKNVDPFKMENSLNQLANLSSLACRKAISVDKTSKLDNDPPSRKDSTSGARTENTSTSFSNVSTAFKSHGLDSSTPLKSQGTYLQTLPNAMVMTKTQKSVDDGATIIQMPPQTSNSLGKSFNPDNKNYLGNIRNQDESNLLQNVESQTQAKMISSLANQQLLNTLHMQSKQQSPSSKTEKPELMIEKQMNPVFISFVPNVEILTDLMNKTNSIEEPISDNFDDQQLQHQKFLQNKLQAYNDIEQVILLNRYRENQRLPRQRPASFSEKMGPTSPMQKLGHNMMSLSSTPKAHFNDVNWNILQDLRRKHSMKQNRRGSSLNSLDEEMETSTKNPSFNLNSQFEDLTLSSLESERFDSNRRRESFLSAFSMPDLGSYLHRQDSVNSAINNRSLRMIREEDFGDDLTGKNTPGTYARDERMLRILKYKKKIMKWRIRHPLNRNFSGRSAVAGNKPRIKGKFVTREEYEKYMDKGKPILSSSMELETTTN